MDENTRAAPAVNSWLTALWQAAQTVQPQIAWPAVYAASGVPFVYVAAESWFDPATILAHPRMQTLLVPDLISLRQLDVAQWAAGGIAVTQHWFATPQQLVQFLVHPRAGAVVVWGGNGPEYGVLIAHTDTTLMIQRGDGSVHALPYAALFWRNGIDVAVLGPCPVVPLPAYAPLAHACACLDRQTIVRFDTPTHPLRQDQAWHVGRGAFEIMALTADHAAPLALVAPHVAAIMYDFWQRFGIAQQLCALWADCHPLPAGRQLLHQAADTFVDGQFFLGIVCAQFPLATAPRALSHAEGDLVAAACRDVRVVLDDVALCMRQALYLWQTHTE